MALYAAVKWEEIDTDIRASEDEVMITRLLEKSIRRTEAVDREALCIVAGEKVRSHLLRQSHRSGRCSPSELQNDISRLSNCDTDHRSGNCA